MNKKIIAPIAVIVGMTALSVGTTYAIFSSKASSEIDLTAGRVQVTMTSTLDWAESRYEDEDYFDAVAEAAGTEMDAIFENRGTAKVGGSATSAVLTLDRLAPMDAVGVELSAINTSNISVKWRYVVEMQGELIPALEIYLNDELVPTGTEKVYGLWSDVVLPPTSEEEAELFAADLEIYFPDGDKEGYNPLDPIGPDGETNDNIYQNKQGVIKVSIEMVQGNANVKDDDSIKTAQQLMDFVSAWNNGTSTVKDLVLGADIDLSEETWVPLGTWDNPYNGEVNGNGHKIIGLSNQGKTVEEIELETFETTTTHSFGAAYGLIGVAGSKEEGNEVVVKNIEFEDVDINLADGNCTGAVLGYAPQNSDFNEKAGGIGAGNFAVSNVTIENVTVEGEVHGKDSVAGIMGKAYNPGKLVIKDSETDVLVEATNGRSAGLVGYASLPSATEIVNNVVNNDVKATKTGVHGVVLGYTIGADHLVYDNEFNGDLYWQGSLVTTESGLSYTYHFDTEGKVENVEVVVSSKQPWETGILGLKSNVTVKDSTFSWDFSVSGTNNKFINVTTNNKLSIDGELTIDGGTYKGANNVGYNDGRVGHLTVKNGDFPGLLSLFSGDISIENGTFKGGPRVRPAQGDAIINISGGRYTVKPFADATEVARTVITYIGGSLSDAKDADGYYYFIPEK